MRVKRRRLEGASDAGARLSRRRLPERRRSSAPTCWTASFGLAGGFDTYDDRVPRRARAARRAWKRNGAATPSPTRRWPGSPPPRRTPRAARPFFAWVHFYDPHAPYDPPQEYLQKANGNAYDGEVAFADAQAGRLLDWLRASGQEASTIVAVAGDHGEGLGDHGELTHGMLAYDSTLRVPLVVVVPPDVRSQSSGSSRLQAGDSIDANVSLADLAGTLLQAAGVAVPAGMRKGPLGSSGEAYAETLYPRSAGWHALSALAFDQWKLIASSESELYDVRADPGETHNLADETLAVADGARRRVGELAAAGAGASASPMSADAAERRCARSATCRAVRRRSTMRRRTRRGASPPGTRSSARRARTVERRAAARRAGGAGEAGACVSRLARVPGDLCARVLKDTGRAADAVAIYRRLVSRWPGTR